MIPSSGGENFHLGMQSHMEVVHAERTLAVIVTIRVGINKGSSMVYRVGVLAKKSIWETRISASSFGDVSLPSSCCQWRLPASRRRTFLTGILIYRVSRSILYCSTVQQRFCFSALISCRRIAYPTSNIIRAKLSGIGLRWHNPSDGSVHWVKNIRSEWEIASWPLLLAAHSISQASRGEEASSWKLYQAINYIEWTLLHH